MPKSGLLVLGRILKARGLRGEVKAFATCDSEEMIRRLRGVYLKGGEGTPQYHPLEKVRCQGPFLFLQFRGVESPEEARKLVGLELCIPREEAPPPPLGSYYYYDIIGLTVVSEEGEELGEVVDIMPTPASDIYVVKGKKEEWFLPAVREMVLQVDVEEGRLVIRPIEGLIEPEAV
ncbi:MAG: 16S rRNA processing protein RimM [candidate division NC10 bacterium]|nr:16S rRNA processing protein RimM [candidate division NC10 bacterium]